LRESSSLSTETKISYGERAKDREADKNTIKKNNAETDKISQEEAAYKKLSKKRF